MLVERRPTLRHALMEALLRTGTAILALRMKARSGSLCRASRCTSLRGRRHGNMSGPVDLEDRDRNTEVLQYAVDQAPLLPRLMIRAAQCDQNMIRSELPDRVREGSQWCLVPDLGADIGFRRERLNVAEDCFEALVRFVTGSVGVRCKPLEWSGQDRRHHKDLRRGIDQRANE